MGVADVDWPNLNEKLSLKMVNNRDVSVDNESFRFRAKYSRPFLSLNNSGKRPTF